MNILNLVPEIKYWEFEQEFFTFPRKSNKIDHNVLASLWLSLCAQYNYVLQK